MKIEDTALFLIEKIKFKTPDGFDDFYFCHNIERMLETDTFYSFADKMRGIFIEKLDKIDNVEEPHKVFAYYHLFKGLEKEIKELHELLSKIHNPTIEDFEKIQKECIDISNYSKFIYDKSKYMIKKLEDK